MKSGWVDREAQAAIERYARDGISRDLALRVYTTRLIGRDPSRARKTPRARGADGATAN